MRTSSPLEALDYPHSETPELFVIWHSNGVKWPDGRRQLKYLSSVRTHVMNGSALFTMNIGEADTFVTWEKAVDFLKGQERRRGGSYGGLQISTIRELQDWFVTAG